MLQMQLLANSEASMAANGVISRWKWPHATISSIGLQWLLGVMRTYQHYPNVTCLKANAINVKLLKCTRVGSIKCWQRVCQVQMDVYATFNGDLPWLSLISQLDCTQDLLFKLDNPFPWVVGFTHHFTMIYISVTRTRAAMEVVPKGYTS